jgi:hypothetical protein
LLLLREVIIKRSIGIGAELQMKLHSDCSKIIDLLDQDVKKNLDVLYNNAEFHFFAEAEGNIY